MCMIRGCLMGAAAMLAVLVVFGRGMLLSNWTSPFNLIVFGIVALFIATRFAKHWGEKIDVPGGPGQAS